MPDHVLPTPSPAPQRPRLQRARRAVRLLTGVTTTIALSGALVVATGAPDGTDAPVSEDLRLAAGDASSPAPTRVRISTFNVLGYGHTDDKGANRKGFVDGRTRQTMVNQLIRSQNLQIVGFQEIESPQISQFKAELGATYDIWPGRTDSRKGYHPNVDGNSIAWRKDIWTAVSTSMYKAPYFKGSMQDRPIVMLQHNVTGQRIIVSNTHNPANSFGDAQRLRNQAVNIQAATFNALRAQHPGVPILFTGDMNDTQKFFCRFVRRTNYTFQASNGGTVSRSSCSLPRTRFIDWIMGTNDVTFSGYQQLRTPYIKRATDHPLIWTDVTIKSPAFQAAGLRRAVVLDVAGLPSAALSSRYARFVPNLRRLLGSGAATLNARTTPESSAAVPNLVSLLTGRAVDKRYGGHGTLNGKRRTVGAATGRYARSVFDQVHDWGGSTSFMSTDRAAGIVIRSWKNSGAADKQGVSYGRSKLSVSSLRRDDLAMTKVLKTQLLRSPRALSVAQFTAPRGAGQKHGFLSRKYLRALQRTDRQIGRIQRTIARTPRLARSTMLVVTGDSGGHGKRARGRAATNYTVPFIVWGNGITAGQDLYALNPAYRSPGASQVWLAGPQPIRPGVVANLVTSLLGLPAVPRSTLNRNQDFNVFVRR